MFIVADLVSLTEMKTAVWVGLLLDFEINRCLWNISVTLEYIGDFGIYPPFYVGSMWKIA